MSDLVRQRAREHQVDRHGVACRFRLDSSIEQIHDRSPSRRPHRGSHDRIARASKVAGFVRDQNDVKSRRLVCVLSGVIPRHVHADGAVDPRQLTLGFEDDRPRGAGKIVQVKYESDRYNLQHHPPRTILPNRIRGGDYARRNSGWSLVVRHRDSWPMTTGNVYTAMVCGEVEARRRAASSVDVSAGKKHSILRFCSMTSRGVAKTVIVEKKAIDTSPLRNCMATSGGSDASASGVRHLAGTPE